MNRCLLTRFLSILLVGSLVFDPATSVAVSLNRCGTSTGSRALFRLQALSEQSLFSVPLLGHFLPFRKRTSAVAENNTRSRFLRFTVMLPLALVLFSPDPMAGLHFMASILSGPVNLLVIGAVAATLTFLNFRDVRRQTSLKKNLAWILQILALSWWLTQESFLHHFAFSSFYIVVAVLYVKVHELGHYVPSYLFGIRPRLNFASVTPNETLTRRLKSWKIVAIALGGPVAGALVGIVIFFFSGPLISDALRLSLSRIIFVMTFINLLPLMASGSSANDGLYIWLRLTKIRAKWRPRRATLTRLSLKSHVVVRRRKIQESLAEALSESRDHSDSKRWFTYDFGLFDLFSVGIQRGVHPSGWPHPKLLAAA